MTNSPQISIVASVFKGEAYLPGFFENLAAQTIFDRCELILVHNQPGPEAAELVEVFQNNYPDQVRVVLVEKVEPLGASWNRGWRLARGEFVAIWNIDDRRSPDSLERQAQALNLNPDCCLAYGDYIISRVPGGPEGWFTHTPPFVKQKFLRRMATGGAFMLFRRNIVLQAGYFDEQLRIAADFDFYLRLLHLDQRFCRTEGMMGYFTDAQQGLSTRESGRLLHVEMNVVHLRYGIYDKLRWELLKKTRAYRLDAVFFENEWQPLTHWPVDFSRPRLPVPVIWVSSFTRNTLRLGLETFGLWDDFLRLRDSVARRGHRV